MRWQPFRGLQGFRQRGLQRLSDEVDGMAVGPKKPIRSQQHEAFGLSLRDDEAIERVAVDIWQIAIRHHVTAFDRELAVAVGK